MPVRGGEGRGGREQDRGGEGRDAIAEVLPPGGEKFCGEDGEEATVLVLLLPASGGGYCGDDEEEDDACPWLCREENRPVACGMPLV